jgi:hypothetical protein
MKNLLLICLLAALSCAPVQFIDGTNHPVWQASRVQMQEYFPDLDADAAQMAVFNSRRYQPPLIYAIWLAELEQCLHEEGLETLPVRVENIEWWVADDIWLLYPKQHNGRHLTGYAPEGMILIDDQWVDNETTIKHELIHNLIPIFANGSTHDELIFRSCASSGRAATGDGG